MPKNYHQLVPHAFKRFSVQRAPHTLIPTLTTLLSKQALPTSDKPALCTMNILPPLMTVWYHFAKRAVSERADIVIFDCSGKLKKEEFPGALVLPFLNLYAATKGTIFLRTIARNRKIGWLCDDDVFLMSEKAVDKVEQALSTPNTASFSFKPRPWWHFEIDGTRYEPSGTYSLALNREIVVEKEELSLAPRDGNTHPAHVGNRSVGTFDTFDYANEILLKKGYTCAILPEEERSTYVTIFHGVSNGVMMLNYFTKPEQTMDYFLSPERKQWGGTVLHRVFSAMLVIDIMQELYEKLTGKTYPLPSLPSREELTKIRTIAEPLLREALNFTDIDEAGEKLKSAL